MSAEVLTTLGSFGTLLVAVVAGFGWVITRMDHRFAQVDARFVQVDHRFAQVDARFAQVEEKFDRVDARFARMEEKFDRIDEKFERVEERFDGLNRELTEVKVAVARIEGPRPRFLSGQ